MNGNGNGGLYFIVGGLAVIAVIGIFLYTNGSLGGRHSSGATMTIEHTVTPQSSSTTIEKK